MFAMFSQFFNMLTSLFSAGERFASSANNMGVWCEEASGGFADEARIKRQARLNELMAETGVAIAAGGLVGGATEVKPTKRITNK